MNRVAVLTAKGLAVLAAAAFAVGGGAVVATTTTGSANPAVWGRHLEAIVSDQVVTKERDTGSRSSADPSASAGQHQREERRNSNNHGSAPATNSRSHEPDCSPNDGSHDGSHKGMCDARNERHRPPPSHRH